jgi:hypothetical protein
MVYLGLKLVSVYYPISFEVFLGGGEASFLERYLVDDIELGASMFSYLFDIYEVKAVIFCSKDKSLFRVKTCGCWGRVYNVLLLFL